VDLVLTAGDVGGQRTLRPYWRNYFESTDAVVWVVDSSDALRLNDGAAELRALLAEEVGRSEHSALFSQNSQKRLGTPGCEPWNAS